ncbi:cardiolipin synthase [Paenibacillus silviterrae]|uniref:cardiolipin synthase n=1 Tax=Paenibacillus silviterrae TaxID=3242194 RepID=UPI002543C7E5|nr:cardiolipin synthase [Paenibacillus chinjuensis]
MLWIIIVLLLFISQILTVLIGEFRHPSKTVAWMVILFMFPLIGFLMYYFLAKEYSQRRKVRRKGIRYVTDIRYLGKKHSASEHPLEEGKLGAWRDEPRLFALLSNIPGSLITQLNEVRVLTNAQQAYPVMLEALEQATHHIHFQYYTYRHDRIGLQFHEVLLRKAKEGVKVRCIFDGIGSYKLNHQYIKQLKEAGAEIYMFLPALVAFFDKRMNYRNHRKIIVVDGLKGFLGGINIGDEYLGANPRLGFWRDTHLELRGDAVYSLQQTFLTDWAFVTGHQVADPLLYPEHTCEERKAVQLIASGPDAYWDAILEMFFGAITTAKKRIYITSPYFIPDESIVMALKSAAISGVDVRIIYPDKADSRLVNYASLSFLEELMQAGVRFYSYQKGFIHAKIMIIDHLLATVGTANMDMRSFFSNFELNAVLFDQESIHRLEQDFYQDMKDSFEVKPDIFEKRPKWQKRKEAIARLLSPLF